MRLWRRLRGGHWERWFVDVPVGSEVWHRVRECTYAPTTEARPVRVEARPRPTPLCRGTAECEHYPTWPERIDRLRGLSDDVRVELGLHLEVREPLTWTCHFCGERRPDALVGVRLVRRHLRGIGWAQVPVTVTRRFCEDREACRAAADRWAETFTLAGSIEDAAECP